MLNCCSQSVFFPHLSYNWFKFVLSDYSYHVNTYTTSRYYYNSVNTYIRYYYNSVSRKLQCQMICGKNWNLSTFSWNSTHTKDCQPQAHFSGYGLVVVVFLLHIHRHNTLSMSQRTSYTQDYFLSLTIF